MKRVAFQGGSSIFELGVASDVFCFFSIIKEKVPLSEGELLLLDRLFRRYLRFDELEGGLILMLKSKDCLSCISSSPTELECLGWSSIDLKSNPASATFAQVFARYFEAFEYCVESARAFYDDWGLYKPVRTIVCDMPDYMVEKLRPLDDYENLGPSDEPYWLR